MANQVYFRLLEISVGDRPVPLSTGKLRVLLAALLVNANRPVSIDEIADRLWGDNPPATLRGTVRAYAMRLRQALGDDTGRPRLIHTRSDGYAIELQSHQHFVTAHRGNWPSRCPGRRISSARTS